MNTKYLHEVSCTWRNSLVRWCPHVSFVSTHYDNPLCLQRSIML
jgi:hypothetical protein